MHRVTKTGAHRPTERLGRHLRLGLRSAPPHQHADDREEGHGVDQEHPTRTADGDDETANGGPDGAPHVERQRAESERLPELVLRNQIGLDGLERRKGQRRPGAQAEGECKQAGGGDHIGKGHEGQRGGAHHHPDLATDQQPASIEDVGKRAPRDANQQHRKHARGRNECDEERRSTEVAHQPRGSDALHERADVGGQLGDEERSKHRVTKWCPRRLPHLGSCGGGLAHQLQPYASSAYGAKMRASSPRRMSMLARALLALMFIGLTHTTTPITVRAAPAPVEALLIGDSVLNGLAQGYSTAGRQALAARHSFILDTAGCRRLIAASCRIPPAAAPTNAITVLRADAGQFDRALVVAAGYNDAPDGPFGIGAAVDAMIAEARQQGIHHVIWLTYREAGNVGQYRRSNAVLRSRTDPELVVADWATRSASMPASWFSGDGIHLGGQAAAAMADLIGDTLDQLLPERCTSGTWSGSPAPTGPPALGTAVIGGLQLLPTPARVVDTATCQASSAQVRCSPCRSPG